MLSKRKSTCGLNLVSFLEGTNRPSTPISVINASKTSRELEGCNSASSSISTNGVPGLNRASPIQWSSVVVSYNQLLLCHGKGTFSRTDEQALSVRPIIAAI